jgi:hypothetical protein
MRKFLVRIETQLSSSSDQKKCGVTRWIYCDRRPRRPKFWVHECSVTSAVYDAKLTRARMGAKVGEVLTGPGAACLGVGLRRVAAAQGSRPGNAAGSRRTQTGSQQTGRLLERWRWCQRWQQLPAAPLADSSRCGGSSCWAPAPCGPAGRHRRGTRPTRRIG